MMVDAMPEEVNLTAIKENETPKNGPKKAPIERFFIAGRFDNFHFYLLLRDRAGS